MNCCICESKCELIAFVSTSCVKWIRDGDRIYRCPQCGWLSNEKDSATPGTIALLQELLGEDLVKKFDALLELQRILKGERKRPVNQTGDQS